MCLFTSQLLAQGNLQFNQVVTVTESFTLSQIGFNSWGYTGSVFTVPENKVWKIEKFSGDIIGTNSGSNFLRINNVTDMSVETLNSGPTWLKAGDFLVPSAACTGCGALSGNFLVSIIEFNVIP